MNPTYVGYTNINTYAVVIFTDFTGDFNGGRSFKKDCESQEEIDQEIQNYHNLSAQIVYKEDIPCTHVKMAL